MSKKVLIVGSGIAGIAASIRLAVKGFQVEVFEANAYPGGKLSEIDAGGYRFDAGPSLFTLPELVDELFALAGLDPRDHFSYQRLEVICRYFWEDGQRLTAWSDLNRLVEEVESKLGEPGKGSGRHWKDLPISTTICPRSLWKSPCTCLQPGSARMQ